MFHISIYRLADGVRGYNMNDVPQPKYCGRELPDNSQPAPATVVRPAHGGYPGEPDLCRNAFEGTDSMMDALK